MTTNPDNQPTTTEQTPPTPLRCLTSALISGSLAIAGYWLTTSIAQSLANKPLPSGNVTAMNIAIAVRTLVVGISTLATAVFSLVAVGLVALAIQLTVQRFTQGTKWLLTDQLLSRGWQIQKNMYCRDAPWRVYRSNVPVTAPFAPTTPDYKAAIDNANRYHKAPSQLYVRVPFLWLRWQRHRH